MLAFIAGWLRAAGYSEKHDRNKRRLWVNLRCGQARCYVVTMIEKRMATAQRT